MLCVVVLLCVVCCVLCVVCCVLCVVCCVLLCVVGRFSVNSNRAQFFSTSNLHTNMSFSESFGPSPKLPTTSMSSYNDMISKDLELLWSINEYIRSRPWLADTFSRIVSKYPWRDVVIVVWFFFIIGLIEIGINHFWVGALNLAFALTLRRLLEAKRPIEFDERLQPLTDRAAESFGFPSIETYMSVVVMGHLFFSHKSLVMLPLGIVVCLVVGVSRIYSRSRFPHQIGGSWALGFVGLLVSMHLCERIGFDKMKPFDHGSYVVFLIVCGLANMALAMENNHSRLLWVPKQEFSRVLSEIASGDRGTNEEEEPDNVYTVNFPTENAKNK